MKDGFCTVHHPTEGQDMQALGRKGGSRSPLTKLRKAADDDLREQARQVLSDALAGKTVDKAQLDAARSLFSYRPTEIPRGGQGPELEHPGRGAYTFQQLVESAAEVRLFSQSGWLDTATEAQMLEAVKASRAKARAEQMESTGPVPPAQKIRARSARGDPTPPQDFESEEAP